MGKKGMTKEAAKRIQSSKDRKGAKGDMRFKSRAMKAASKSTQKK